MKKILITGGFGFIGSNTIHYLKREYEDIKLTVLDTTLDFSEKYSNLLGIFIDEFVFVDTDFSIDHFLYEREFDTIIHFGAISRTDEKKWDVLNYFNVGFTKSLFSTAYKLKIKVIYASSASVYGNSTHFSEDSFVKSIPLNLYGYSKWLIDMECYKAPSDAQIYGLRFFNVWGPHEGHKQGMMSPVSNFTKQALSTREIKLFDGFGDYLSSDFSRDFVHVDSVISYVDYLLKNDLEKGIFNVGTGVSVSFNEIAKIISDFYGNIRITHVPFPEQLKKSYQFYTKSDNKVVSKMGFPCNFKPIQGAIYDHLAKHG